MTEADNNERIIRCPTCNTEHKVTLEPGQTSEPIRCACDRVLLVERSAAGNSIIVREQFTGEHNSWTSGTAVNVRTTLPGTPRTEVTEIPPGE